MAAKRTRKARTPNTVPTTPADVVITEPVNEPVEIELASDTPAREEKVSEVVPAGDISPEVEVREAVSAEESTLVENSEVKAEEGEVVPAKESVSIETSEIKAEESTIAPVQENIAEENSEAEKVEVVQVVEEPSAETAPAIASSVSEPIAISEETVETVLAAEKAAAVVLAAEKAAATVLAAEKAAEKILAAKKVEETPLATEKAEGSESEIVGTTGAGLEISGIERVPEDKREHKQLWDTMWLWLSANSVMATVAIGILNVWFGLGFWGSIGVIVAFNILGCLPVAFLSTLGPKTGLAQMPLTRFSFGFMGARLPAFFNACACIGWSAVNTVIGAGLLTQLSGGAIPQWAGLIILTVVTALISVFGYFIVHRYERFAWIPMFIMFAFIAFQAYPNADFSSSVTVSGLALFSSIATFGGAVFGFAAGWSSYAADYTRYQPANTSPMKVFIFAFFGTAIPCILFESLGVLLTSAVVSDHPTAEGLIGTVLTGHPLATLVLVLLAFSTIANNVPSDYSFALSLQVVGIHMKRWTLTLVGAALYLALSFAIQANFKDSFSGFLLLIAYWLGAWNAIVLLEHFLRKGRYPVEDYDQPAKLPVGIAALVALVLGLVAAALGINQSALVAWAEGPIAKMLEHADVGFPLALITAAILYYPLRRWELAKYKR